MNTSIIEVLDAIARVSAITCADINPTVSAEDALDNTVEGFISCARAARTRTGLYEYEATSEQVERAMFWGCVAMGVKNNVYLPSSGPSRDYALAKMADILVEEEGL